MKSNASLETSQSQWSRGTWWLALSDKSFVQIATAEFQIVHTHLGPLMPHASGAIRIIRVIRSRPRRFNKPLAAGTATFWSSWPNRLNNASSSKMWNAWKMLILINTLHYYKYYFTLSSSIALCLERKMDFSIEGQKQQYVRGLVSFGGRVCIHYVRHVSFHLV